MNSGRQVLGAESSRLTIHRAGLEKPFHAIPLWLRIVCSFDLFPNSLTALGTVGASGRGRGGGRERTLHVTRQEKRSPRINACVLVPALSWHL